MLVVMLDSNQGKPLGYVHANLRMWSVICGGSSCLYTRCRSRVQSVALHAKNEKGVPWLIPRIRAVVIDMTSV